MKYGMLIDLHRCINCGGCVMACKTEHATNKDVYWSSIHVEERGDYPYSRLSWIPMGCMHCSNAPCVKSCPTGASYIDDAGRVLIDDSKCIGCRVCVNSCPYGARHYVYDDSSENPYWGEGREQTAYEKVFTDKMHQKDTTEKCIFCYDRVEAGEQPACVQTCVGKARIMGDLDDPESEINRAIKEKDAKPFHAELGTDPCFYYAGTF